MQKLYQEDIKLHTLVIFRGLLQDPVVCNLIQLLEMDHNVTKNTVNAYCEFASALFAVTENLSDYLLKWAVEDENLYMLRKAQGKPISEELEQCLVKELEIIQEISRLTSKQFKAVIDWNGFLPEWTTTDYDFVELYQERIRNLSTQGYGIFAKYHTFLVKNDSLVPVKHPDETKIENLKGYEREREAVLENTRALLQGKPAANVLLYGDAGTGKSSTVKAVANHFCGQGLRLIELKKNQLHQIPELVDRLSKNPLKFILFIDDLSFTKNDDDFAALKAILEGSVAAKTSNLAVYATSNRRHLIKESFSDREGDEIHLNDTMQELISLSDRFGLTITFIRPDKKLYLKIVMNLAEQSGVTIEQESLCVKAEAYALRRGGRSPRVARQFVESLMAEEV